jgi:lysophospholipase L1-like esterase
MLTFTSTARPIVGVAVVVLMILFLIGEPSLPRRSSSSLVISPAQALSTSSPTTAHNHHRIFCYGDSLTAGVVAGSSVLVPYAPYLQQGLPEAGRSNHNNVQVRHLGWPGWTTQQMLDRVNESPYGLQAAIRRIQDPSPSIVILLAGTNDLGYGYSAEQIAGNLRQLHQVALDHGVRATMAIAVPPSGYIRQNANARALQERVNQELLEYASRNDSKTTFVPFPFDYDEHNGEYWSADTLHFSALGYQRLGESLVNVVADILDRLED